MPAWDHLLPFLAATFVFAVMPGPGMLYAMAQTMGRGRRHGFYAALGLSLGGLVHVGAAAAGLSALFRYAPAAFLAVKLAGALYLVWLGIQTIRAKGAVQPARLTARGARRVLLQSATVELLNPKTALFFIAFLPQFVDPAAALPLWGQFLALGLSVNLAFSVADICAVLLTDRALLRLQRSPRLARLVRLAGGSLLIGLGAETALGQG